MEAAHGGIDPTQGLERLDSDLNDMDLKKQVRRPTTAKPAEGIIEGATHDSIGKFVRAQQTQNDGRVSTSLMARLRQLFRR